MFSRIVVRNLKRHPLRSLLTAVGIAIALLAFCMIRTIIDAWHMGVKASAKNRLITRSAVSLILPLPVSYKERIAKVAGVERVGSANWFGGVYKDERYRFAQFAGDDDYLESIPELIISPAEKQAYAADQKGALVGEMLANKYGFKVGDVLPIRGTIYPGQWEFTVRGIIRSKKAGTVTDFLFFHWKNLNEYIRVDNPSGADQAGWFIILLKPEADPALTSQAIDNLFANSPAETKTETETAFTQGFVSMSSTILMALDAISFIVILIILLVLANTMLMSARERIREYCMLKALGFRPAQIAALIFGESIIIAIVGVVLLAALLVPVFTVSANFILGQLATFFPVFKFNLWNFFYAVLIALAVALLSSLIPAASVARLKVAEGLRKVE